MKAILSFAVFLALKHEKTPVGAKILAALTVAYALSPIDLIPDFNYCGNYKKPYFSAITSISTNAPLGSAPTSTQLRAGFPVKYFS